MDLVDAVIEHVADLRIGERQPRHLAVDAVEHAHRVGAQEPGDPVAAREQRHGGDGEADRHQGDDVRMDPKARAQQHQRPDDRRIDPARQQVGRALVVLPEHLPLEALSGRAVGDRRAASTAASGAACRRRPGRPLRRPARSGRRRRAHRRPRAGRRRRPGSRRPAPARGAAPPRARRPRRAPPPPARALRRRKPIRRGSMTLAPSMATRSAPAARARRRRVPSGAASASTSAPGQPAGVAPGPESTTCAPSLALAALRRRRSSGGRPNSASARATAEVSIQSFICVRDCAGAAGRSRRTAAAPRARW